ncbi:ORF1 [Lepus torque teno virus 1]|uniref:Capsid protein n=1 Tax=Lepus torque teno virus 1 TaxID=2716318 RepID=A0A6G7NNU8_9VIRU|nr:ORF1 [Lepus torque teno virus 1]QIJ55523.1 ORF1 [Lepus torque teno virus 1]
MRYTRRRRRWGRRRRFWRRPYRRRRFARRRFRRGRGKRRRGRRRVRWLFEFMPRFWRRCIIRGWWPVLATGYRPPDKTHNTEAKQMSSFKPQTCFGMVNVRGWFYGNNYVNFGGYSCGTFSLTSLYQEHLMMRNRWSQSNCGFDLGTYRGTKITFVPHPQLDYLVYVDAEYRDFNLWMKQCMHPAVLITHPSTRLIRSIAHGGPRRRLPKMFVPPPSTMNSGWSWMKDLAGQGLFAWWVCWLDLHNPWFAHVEDPNVVKWWDKGQENQPPTWYQDWFDLQQMSVGDQIMAVYGSGKIGDVPSNFENGNRYDKLAYGPFIYKNKPNAQVDYGFPQITFFYKSYWQWGGSTTTIKKVCNPEQDAIAGDVTFLRNFGKIELKELKLKGLQDSDWRSQNKGPTQETHWQKWHEAQRKKWHGGKDGNWPDLTQMGEAPDLSTNYDNKLQPRYRTTSDGRFRYGWDPDRTPQWRPKY